MSRQSIACPQAHRHFLFVTGLRRAAGQAWSGCAQPLSKHFGMGQLHHHSTKNLLLARNLDFGAARKKLGPDRSLCPPAGLASRPGNHSSWCPPPLAPAPRLAPRRDVAATAIFTGERSYFDRKRQRRRSRTHAVRSGKGDRLAPRRSAGVRLARGQSVAAPQHLRRGPASSADHSSSRRRRRGRTNSSRRHGIFLPFINIPIYHFVLVLLGQHLESGESFSLVLRSCSVISIFCWNLIPWHSRVKNSYVGCIGFILIVVSFYQLKRKWCSFCLLKYL
jgi:hypothetical protein